MTKEIILPRLSPNMEMAVLVAWNKEVGDEIKMGESIYEIETDKVVSEVESSINGILISKCAEEGDRLTPGDTLGVIEEQ